MLLVSTNAWIGFQVRQTRWFIIKKWKPRELPEGKHNGRYTATNEHGYHQKIWGQSGQHWTFGRRSRVAASHEILQLSYNLRDIMNVQSMNHCKFTVYRF